MRPLGTAEMEAENTAFAPAGDSAPARGQKSQPIEFATVGKKTKTWRKSKSAKRIEDEKDEKNDEEPEEVQAIKNAPPISYWKLYRSAKRL